MHSGVTLQVGPRVLLVVCAASGPFVLRQKVVVKIVGFAVLHGVSVVAAAVSAKKERVC